MKRQVPRLTTDEEAEAFLDSDLSDLDYSQFKSGRLRFARGGQHVAETVESTAPTKTYRLFERAMSERKQIACMYKGYYREVCPVILGHTGGKERALTYQFSGESNSQLPPGGEWRCLTLASVTNVQLRDGPWYSGDTHKQPSSCVEVVDLDVNPKSPYNPKRRLETTAASKGRRAVRRTEDRIRSRS